LHVTFSSNSTLHPQSNTILENYFGMPISFTSIVIAVYSVSCISEGFNVYNQEMPLNSTSTDNSGLRGGFEWTQAAMDHL